MKDINGIKTVSIKEQALIQQWYIITRRLIALMITSIVLYHAMQLYLWSQYTLSLPLCLHTEEQWKARHTQSTEFLCSAQKSLDHMQHCKEKSAHCSSRLEQRHMLFPLIESLDMKKKEMLCTVHCINMEECIQIMNRLRNHTGVQSVTFISMKADNTSPKKVICTLACHYL
jgi:hypothetical protein